jgi:hypothetical protein
MEPPDALPAGSLPGVLAAAGGGGRPPAFRAPLAGTVSAEIVPSSWSNLATSLVHPVSWPAPMPAPLSP